MRRESEDAAAEARLLADARRDFRSLVREGLVARTDEAWQAFLAGFIAMHTVYKQRAAVNTLSDVA